MHQSIICPICGGAIRWHYELFAHVHWPPVEVAGATRQLLERLQRITGVVRARYYGLGPMPWRLTVGASGPRA